MLLLHRDTGCGSENISLKHTECRANCDIWTLNNVFSAWHMTLPSSNQRSECRSSCALASDWCTVTPRADISSASWCKPVDLHSGVIADACSRNNWIDLEIGARLALEFGCDVIQKENRKVDGDVVMLNASLTYQYGAHMEELQIYDQFERSSGQFGAVLVWSGGVDKITSELWRMFWL